MSGASREKDQADFDLESFIELFDEAMTSDDPNVQKTLGHLMTIVALTRNHNKHSDRHGPLRRLFEDMRTLNQRLSNLEMQRQWTPTPMPSTPSGPTIWPQPIITTPNTGTPAWPPGHNIWYGAKSSGSSTSYAWDPKDDMRNIALKGAVGSIAERVEDILKDPQYSGSAVGTSDVKSSA